MKGRVEMKNLSLGDLRRVSSHKCKRVNNNLKRGNLTLNLKVKLCHVKANTRYFREG